MADRVIVVGTTRGKQMVPASELRQMIGRAGREHGKSAVADVVIDAGLEVDLHSPESFEVKSSLNESVDFHIMPEICASRVRDLASASAWWSRSFLAFHNKKINFEKVFNRLLESGAIIWDGVGVEATPVGRVASTFYFHPNDIAAWRSNFEEVFGHGLENDDMAIAWALGNVPSKRVSGDFGKHWWVVNKCLESIPAGLETRDGATSTIALWWHLTGGPPVGLMKNQAIGLKRDYGRMNRAFTLLNKEEGWNMGDFLDELEFRINRKLPSELVPLCRIQGITKSMAEYLYNMGIQGVDDFPDAFRMLDKDEDGKLYEIVRKVVDELPREST